MTRNQRDRDSSLLYEKKIRIFDYPHFAQLLQDELIAHAHKIASENNLSIEYLPKKNSRQEDRIAEILKERGDHPGLVHIFSVQESCTSYKPWHDRNTHNRYLEFISTLDDNQVGSMNLHKISKNVTEKNHTYKGFYFFNDGDQQIFLTIVRGEFNIRGFQNKNLRHLLLYLIYSYLHYLHHRGCSGYQPDCYHLHGIDNLILCICPTLLTYCLLYSFPE